MIELLIVIGVMGILAVVGLDSFVFSLAKGRDAQRKSDLAAVAKALETFQNDFNRYPLSSDGLIAGCGNGSQVCSWGTAFEATINTGEQTYMSVLPTESTTGGKYYYVSDGRTFSLYAILENPHDKAYQDVGVSCGSNPCYYQLTETGVIYP